MKKIYNILLVSFFILGQQNFLSAQDWVRQYPFDIINRINDVIITDEGFGWAVGAEDAILYTENNGTLWTIQETPNDQYPLNAVAYIPGSNGQKAFAGGNIFYRTEDGGQTWEQVFTGVSILSILDIDVLSPEVIIVSASGGMARSEDGGSTWVEIGAFTDVLNSSHWLDLQTGFTNSSDTLYRTTDGGQTWDAIFGIADEYLNSVEFVDANTGYLLGANNMFKTTNGGADWLIINNEALSFSANDLHVLNASDLYISYNNGGTLGSKSTDGGQNWTDIVTDAFVGRSFGVFANAEGVWFTGEMARIGFSSDGGANFVDQIPGNKKTLRSVDFVNDQNGFAAGYDGTVLRTTNGGMIWESISVVDASSSVNDISMFDANTTWLCSSTGVFVTQDGGDNWTQVLTEVNVNAIHALSESEAIGITSLGVVRRTADTGATWTDVATSTVYSARDIEFIDQQTGWIAGTSGRLIKTTDGGLTWTPQSIGADYNLGGVDFVDANTGWAIPDVYSDSVWHTADGGATWDAQSLGSSTFWHSVAFQDANTGWVVGGGSGIGRIRQTIDGGQTWSVAHNDVAPFNDIDAPVDGEAIVWAVGSGGNIMKLAPCDNIPNLEALLGEQNPCIGDTLVYEVIGTDIAEYDWTLPNGWNIFGNSNTALIHIIIGSESGQLRIQGSNTCENSNLLTLDLVPVSKPDTPAINFDGLTLSTTAVADSYQWYRDGNVSSDDASFVPQFSGVYSLIVTSNGCASAPSDMLEVLVTNISEPVLGIIRVHPNPGFGVFQIEGVSPDASTTITVNDISGKVVYEKRWQDATLNLPYQNAGLYIIRIQTVQQTYLGKFVIK